MDGAENVVKQGYLKKGNSANNRLSNLFRRADTNKWFVFTIRAGVPFLEYYDRDVDVFNQEPINSFNLTHCYNIKYMGSSNPHTFCVVCEDRVIELIASSRNQMTEWVRAIESSLNRLGILQSETSDHVYTVCPAVVRQARVSKEVLEEREKEKSNRQDPVVPSDANSVTMRRPVPQVVINSDSCVSSQENNDLVPPLPARPGYPIRRAHSLNNSSKSSGKSQRSEEDFTGSNDSDFVSPEVIREIRRSYSLRVDSGLQLNELSTEQRNVLDEEDNNPDIHATHVEIASIINKVKSRSHEPNITPKPERLKSANKQPDEGSLSSSLDSLSSTEPETLLSIANVVPKSNPVENDYSVLPGQEEAAVSLSNNHDSLVKGAENNVCDNQYQELPQQNRVVAKPIPRPRKAMSKRWPDDGEDMGAMDDHVDEISSHDVYDYLPQRSHRTLTSDESVDAVTMSNGIDGDSSFPLQHSQCDHVTQNGSDSLTELKVPEVFFDNAVEKTTDSQSSKDENENFYGLMYDSNTPPTTVAPPIPPLPPRNDSTHPKFLSIAFRDNTMTATAACQTDTKVSLSSTSHNKAPVENLYSPVPPLPQPRKRLEPPPITDRASAFTSNGPLEIPPMLPRRHSPKPTEDRPPALPSRNTQSFIIKRPQLTSSISVDCASGGAAQRQWHCGSLDRGLTNAVALQSDKAGDRNSGGKGSSGLSRKMLLDRSHSMHTVVSLKQTQAEILQHEISLSSVTVSLTQKSGHGLALVDWMDSPCVVGWNQKDFSSLHGKLHVGDLLYSVNKVKVTSSDVAYKLLKQTTEPQIEVVLRRIPYAQVFAIRRSAEGQSLGIKREGGTGEIVYVDPNGLAAQHGLPHHAISVKGQVRCNWFITEINNRPINLFFKENEIEHRLSAVGREISIVVQPSDFIFEIRKLFKKIKSYKTFIVQ